MNGGLPTPIEIAHYKALEGKTISRVEFENFQGHALPILKFTDGSDAAVMSDPEGNDVGFLELGGAS